MGFADLMAVAWWALRMRWRVRGQVVTDGLDGLRLRPAPPSPPSGLRVTRLVLSLTRANCLARSAVLQQWHAAQGSPRDLVIGVTPPSRGFQAHAWLEHPGALTRSDYVEIRRRPA